VMAVDALSFSLPQGSVVVLLGGHGGR
jgi:ABC-type multidrug transport system ATPase subunit